MSGRVEDDYRRLKKKTPSGFIQKAFRGGVERRVDQVMSNITGIS
jgi:hypothetical protein